MQQQETPTVLADRYQLGAVLGRGGMADVHRAHDRVLGREVAVKVLRDTTGDEGDMQRFTAEARTLAGLSHPGLVMVLDAGFSDAHPFLVMDLVDGQTLAACCTGAALDPAEVATIGAQLADALAYAHDRGVVHRDVKPGNVLLGPEGRVKLADFGIARLIGDTVRHTRTGHAIGTAAYLAPEQVRGEEITTAVDVYSLGLVLLEALTGERAFPGPAMEAALARLHRSPDVPADLPAPWPDLLARMTRDDPASRPSAAEVAGLLRTPDAVAPAPPTAPLPTHDPETRPLTGLVAGSGPAETAPPPARIDRAGDALAARARTWGREAREAARRTPAHVRGALAAVAAIVVLLVVAALAGGGDTAADETPPAGRESGQSTQQEDAPAPLDRGTDTDSDPGAGSDAGDTEDPGGSTDAPGREGWDEKKLEKWLEKLEKKRDKEARKGG